MAFGPEHSALKSSKALEARINAAQTSAEIMSILHKEEVRQGLREPDTIDPTLLLPTARALAAEAGQLTKSSTTIVVDGKSHLIEADTPEELVAAQNQFYREQFAGKQPASNSNRDDRGRFVDQGKADEADERAAAAELVRKAELDLRFKRGELDTATYLEQSGAIETTLANSWGVSVDDLKAAAQEKSAQRGTESWAQATTEFLNSAEGRSWPGGEANKNKLGEILVAMGAAEAPNAENIRRAASHMAKHHLFVPNPDTEMLRAIGEAQSTEELKAALRGGKTSSLFDS